MQALSPSSSVQPTSHADRESPSNARSIVQAETNLLRFPFFSLHTKGLKTIDYKEVRGTRTENGKAHEFTFRVSRNTDHLYPGPLSRKAHFALLSLLRKQGFPFRNPIAFTWRQLAREMQISYSGSTTVQRLKEALLSTFGAMIKSSYALKFGPSRESLPTRERGYSLYAECLFTNDTMPDGSVADRNFVTLADWYLANLNALYAVPMDYALWNRLNEKSPLASRLYEFLLFSFSVGIDKFAINYPKLCQFLPAKQEAYASQAKEQFAPAFALLAAERIIGGCEWVSSAGGEWQLRFSRGMCLTMASRQTPDSRSLPDVFETVSTEEGVNPLAPAERVVSLFHQLWSGGEETHHPTAGELEAARECLDKYGFERAQLLLPRVVKRMREKFPDAKTFGATRPYFAEIQTEFLKREKLVEQTKNESLERDREAEAERQRTERHAALEAVWESLQEQEREAIRRCVIEANPRLRLPDLPGMLHRLCLDELDTKAAHSEGTETR